MGAAIIYAVQNFNSHAHVERDFFCVLPLIKPFISTHTLTWSVTYEMTCHAATAPDFNSHAHVERDGGIQCQYQDQTDFNSHAHVERDSVSGFLSCHSSNFNSHAHVERDLTVCNTRSQDNRFQLTRSRGA